MEEESNINTSKSFNQNNDRKVAKKGLMQYEDDNDNKQILFRIFNLELTAPKELKYPRTVYISFILINLILLVFLKNLILN